MDVVLLVCWIEDNPVKFSIQTRGDIVDGNIRALPAESLLGMIIPMTWNRRTFKAKVLNYGNGNTIVINFIPMQNHCLRLILI